MKTGVYYDPIGDRIFLATELESGLGVHYEILTIPENSENFDSKIFTTRTFSLFMPHLVWVGAL